MAARNDTAEFMEKARQFGLIEEIDRELETRKHERRLAVIEKIRALPAIELTEVPALTKACVESHKALQLAEEEYRAADRQYKELSTQVYGAQLQFDGARITLEREAHSLAPDFLREAFEDLSMLDGLVSMQIRFDIEMVRTGWFGSEAITTSNGDAIMAFSANVKTAQARLTAMLLESTERETALLEVAALIEKAERDAYAIGVSKVTFTERRKPVDVAQKAEDHAARETQKRRSAAQQRRSAIARTPPRPIE